MVEKFETRLLADQLGHLGGGGEIAGGQGGESRQVQRVSVAAIDHRIAAHVGEQGQPRLRAA